MSPFISSFYKVACRGNCVHLRHICMQVELNTLFLRLVNNLYLACSADRPCNKHKLACVAVVLNITLNDYGVAFFQIIENGGVLDSAKNLNRGRASIISNVNYKNVFIARLCDLFFYIENVAPYNNPACIGNNGADRLNFSPNNPAVKRLD